MSLGDFTELTVVILILILSWHINFYSEVSGIQLGHEIAVVAQGSQDIGMEENEMDIWRMADGDTVNSTIEMEYAEDATGFQAMPPNLQTEESETTSFSSWRYNSGENMSNIPREENFTDLQTVGVALSRETKSSLQVSLRIRRRQPQPQDIFITREESNSFLGKSRVRRGKHLKNKGPLPLKDLTTKQFRNFRYRFPERTEWFPSYLEIWEMCVYKKGRKFEGIRGPNKRRKYCIWEEIWEFHRVHHEEGYTYEFASATFAYVQCKRNAKARKDNCPKPCASSPCKGPHMQKCVEIGNDVAKSYTCHCHPGWRYNQKTRKCDDINVCGTSRELCSKTNTIECVEKAGYKHECVCKRKWMGPRCLKPYDACVDYDNPCGQYGKCSAHQGQRTWTCKCMEGWGDDPAQEGRDCKRKNQVCDNVVCLNGGECQASKAQNKAKCICTEEWTGDTCENPMPTWTMWQPWAKCSVTCGYDGTRVRKRDCDHRDADYCGPGTDEEHAVCNGPICKVDGEWGEWIKVTDCSYNCGGGHYINARNCEYDSDDPEAFGESCEGRAIEYADCNIMSCPKSEKRWLRVDINSLARTIVSQTDNVAGDWGAWNSWTECSTTCDVGFRARDRICLSSIGACQGSSEEVEDCNLKNCDKEAGLLAWGSWTYWTKCEKDADFCYRYRECPYSVKDDEFQEACPGKSSQSVPCEADGCGELQEEEEVRPKKTEPEEEETEKPAAAAPPMVQVIQAPQMQYPQPLQYPQAPQWGEPMHAPRNSHRARDRAGTAGESSALGIGSVAALAGIAYMGKILFEKFQKKRKRQKQRKKEATV